ncbi:MAG: Hpt domain-containing protein [Bdellovibrionales bacterium]
MRAHEEHFNTLMNMVPMDLRHLVPGFLERREKDVEDMTLMLNAEDFPSIKASAHKLKGMGAGYGFQIVSDIGREIEAAAIRHDVRGLKSGIDQLAEVTRNLKMILNQRRDF